MAGASAGLGARFAGVLHDAGAHVIVTARRAGHLNELAQERGTRLHVLAHDIADPRHRQALAEHAHRRGRLHVLVNKAGTCDDGLLD